MVNLAAYVGSLLRRASVATGSSIGAIAAHVIAELPESEDTALGA